MTTPILGSNITSIPTSSIQKNLGGLVVDNKYGPKTTAGVQTFQAANNLKVDGIFGPKTEAAYTAKYGTQNPIISTGDIHATAKKNSAALSAALGMFSVGSTSTAPVTPVSSPTGPANPTDPTSGQPYQGTKVNQDPSTTNPTNDPYIAQLNAMSARSNTSTKMLISNIIATKTNKALKIDKEYDNYKKGLQLLGIQHNEAQSSPDLLAGHIVQAENDHMDKINDLDAEESKALMDAETAQANNDFKTLDEKMSYVKDLQTQKSNALKDLQATVSDTSKNATIEAHDIYDTLGTLDDADKESFITAVAKKFNLPLGSLVTALADEKTKRDKADLTTKNTNSIIDKRENPTTSTSTSDTKKKAAAKDEITNALKTGKDATGKVIGNPKGADGYVDPQVYLKYLDAWPGTQKEFLALYPVKGTINPKSYSILPTAIIPKKESSRSAS